MAGTSPSSTSQTQERLRTLLAEMVQADQADLDFGIYRIMGIKRAEFLRFLTDDLFPQVQAALAAHAGGEAETVKAELEKVEAQLRAAGVDPNLSPVVKELREKLAASGTGTNNEAEDEIFSALFSFFRRYYDKGDFLAMPRYKAGVYSIPYSGEEVKLHWANADQYYVKSSESFRDYAFKLPDNRTVHFRLAAADTETDNNKVTPDKDRVFKLDSEEPISEENEALIIRFHYQVDPSKRKQAALNAEASQIVLATLRALDPGPLFTATMGATAEAGFASWGEALAELRPTEKNKDRTLLDLKLADYTARNSFDYFIHKDLGTFLRRELDFFLKNEVLYLDDWDRVEPEDAIIRLRRLSVIRGIAHKIIAFLAQTENLQKRLWLKKKFVVGGGWCVTLDRVPATLYPQVAANEAQRKAWVTLFKIDEIKGDTITPGFSEPLTVEFLEANPLLVLDTQFFDAGFTDILLASFKDLDAATDGLIINGDNFQALSLLGARYEGQVKSVYIDPPYNTNSSEIAYKNGYKDSSWLSLIQDRILLSMQISHPTGIHCVTIDDAELPRLWMLLGEKFGFANHLGTACIRINPGGRKAKRKLALQHEYALFFAKNENVQVSKIAVAPEDKSHNYQQDEQGQWFEERNLRKEGADSAAKPDSDRYFPIYFDPETREISSKKVLPVEIWPVDTNHVKRIWRRSKEDIDTLAEQGDIIHKFGKNGNQLYFLYRGGLDGETPKTLWLDAKYSASEYGTPILDNILGKREIFDFPKSVYAVAECLRVMSSSQDALLLDYFAGSGTTGHAVINLNREDDGQRKYILVEMGQYFDTVLKPRLQKVIYSKDWKDGKPVSRQGSSQLLRYLKLESYEDTLNNLTLRQTPEQAKAIADAPAPAREEYLLRYMLHAEAKDSLLSSKDFADPFGYSMKIATDSAGDSRETPIDLVETFHWLVGMRVQKREVRDGVRLSWGLLPDDRRVLVLWRRVADIDADALDAFFQQHGLGEGDEAPAIIYVNGDNTLRRRRPEGQTWRVELIEPEFLRRMFGETDPFIIAEGA